MGAFASRRRLSYWLPVALTDTRVCLLKKNPNLQRDDWVVVAGIDGTDHELHRLIEDILKRRGILCFFTGSLGYDVFVPKMLAHDAKRTLERATQLRGRLIHFMDYPRGTT